MKATAITCKILAIIISLGNVWFVLNFDFQDLRATSAPLYRDAPPDWGTPSYVHRTYFRIAEAAVLALLALVPNRILVSSGVIFAISLVLALVPLRTLFATHPSLHGIGELVLSGFAVAMVLGMITPLPLSIIFSFLRHRRGERVTYA